MLCLTIANQTKNDTNCSEFKEEARRNTTDFTRNRKMSLEELVNFVLMSIKCSAASALRRFFSNIGKSVFMTQQSLSEARSKITVRAFVRLFKITVNTMTEHCTKKWHGYRVYAVDGSKISLPADKKLCEHFGALGKEKTAPTAQGSVLYDVLNDIIVDAAIEPLTTDERTLAKAHINACKSIAPGDKKLNIYDRGYASFDLIETHENEGLFYLMRVKSKFNNDIDNQRGVQLYCALTTCAFLSLVPLLELLLQAGYSPCLCAR